MLPSALIRLFGPRRMIEVLAERVQPLIEFDIRPEWGEGRAEGHNALLVRPPS